MRLSYILVAAVLALSAHQDPVTASVSHVARSGVISLAVLNYVGADQSGRNQSRFLRGNNIAEGDMEERGVKDVVQQLMAKILVNKMKRTNSFSALKKVDDVAMLDKISDAADDQLVSVFKLADDAQMSPRDLAIQLKNNPEVDDAIFKQAVEMYTKYWAK